MAGMTVITVQVPTRAKESPRSLQGPLKQGALKAQAEVVSAEYLHRLAGMAVHSLRVSPWAVKAPYPAKAPQICRLRVLHSHPHRSWGKPSRLTAGPEGSGSASCGVFANCAPLQGHPLLPEGLLGRPPPLGPCRSKAVQVPDKALLVMEASSLTLTGMQLCCLQWHAEGAQGAHGPPGSSAPAESGCAAWTTIPSRQQDRMHSA